MICPQPKPKSDQRRQMAGLCLALAVITLAVFGKTADFGFVDFDDNKYVYENPVVTQGLNLKGLAWIFTHADCKLYHPLTMLSLMADYQFHGLRAGGYHLTNVILHTASVILLFLILRQMTGAPWRSAFVAAVFAIHPLRVESVAWVAERKDVLGGFFFMLTLAAYVYYVRKSNSLARYLMVVVAFAFALLSKPTVVTLPFVLLLLDYWPLRRFAEESSGQNRKYSRFFSRVILEKIPLLALAAAACVITVLSAGKAVASLANVSALTRFGNALVSYMIYLRQMIWPEGLAVFYPQPENGYPAWETALSFILLALVSTGVLFYRQKRPWLLVGWFWYLGMLMPMIGLVQVGAFAHADRMTYLPLLGICLALTWLVAEWRINRAAIGVLMGSVLAALMVCAWQQIDYWPDSVTLWTHTLRCTADNYLARGHLGLALAEKGKLDEAITQYKEALRIKPDEPESYNNLGNALLQKGRADDAIHQFQQALRFKPGEAEMHYNLGNAFLQKGSAEDAIIQYEETLQIKPDYAAAHVNLSNALLQKGRVDEAISHYEQALQLQPGFAVAHHNLGLALCRKGRADEAIVQYQQALQISPNYVDAHVDLGNVLLQKGKVEEAMAQFQQAQQIAPADPWLPNNLAWFLATAPQALLRNGPRAVQLAQRANQLTGGANATILRTLAASFAEAGQFSEAVETAQRALHLAEAQSNAGLVGALQSELKLYQTGKSFHLSGPTQ
jgi:tetratricopeptide (TPR) repeat protein